MAWCSIACLFGSKLQRLIFLNRNFKEKGSVFAEPFSLYMTYDRSAFRLRLHNFYLYKRYWHVKVS